jgi:GNAT superfamily N-acetyltransferase
MTRYVMPFANASLARRIERAESSLISDFGRAASRQLGTDAVVIREVGGGVAVAAGPGAPFSKVAGLGFEPVSEPDLESLERMYAERATAVRFEVSSLGITALCATLTRRGYVLEGFENVLGIALPAQARRVTGIAVSIDDGQAAPWVDVLATAFSHPDTFDGPAADEPVDRASLDAVFEQIAAVRGFRRYVGRCGDEVAGAGGMRISEGVAQLCGAATLPSHRRRGVQTALLQRRLEDAAQAGCDIAVVTTQPGSVSQENVQRQGFEMLYTRAVLVKPVCDGNAVDVRRRVGNGRTGGGNRPAP